MLNNSLRRLADDFDRKGINYAAVDAVALNRHGYKRFTEYIDILLTPAGLDRFCETLVGLGYRPSFDGPRKKFKITENNIPLDIVTAGEFPGDGLPKPVVFPDPADHVVVIDGVKTITLEKLIELKLASGMTAADRLKDLADVQEIIKIKRLDQQFSMNLDASVRSKCVELVESVQKFSNDSLE